MQANRTLPMSPRNLVFGLDVGTTNIKCLAVDESGAIVAEAALPTPVSDPRPGWTDFEPGPIWQAACRAIQLVVSKLASRDSVKGIAVGSVAESLVPVGSDGQPLASAIAWFDTRTTTQYDSLCERIGYRLAMSKSIKTSLSSCSRSTIACTR